MPDYQIVDRKPSVEEYFALRRAVGWGTGEPADYQIGLDNSLFGVCAVYNGEVIGSARVIGDGRTCFYIQDVMVKPAYQRMGVGLAIMNRVMVYLAKTACPGAIVGLMAAQGKEGFYEQFGFWQRPREGFGPGMMQYWIRANR